MTSLHRDEPASTPSDRADSEICPPRLSTSLAEIPPSTAEWLVPGFLARSHLTDISGAPGSGKSLLTVDLASRFSLGVGLPQHPDLDDPTSTLILGAEDEPGEITRRLQATEANLKLIHMINTVPTLDGDRPVTLTQDYDRIAQEIVELGAGLVILDNAALTLGTGLSSHGGSITGMGLARRLAHDTGASVVTIRHWSKHPTGSAANAGIGSIGISATARVATIVATDPHDPTGAVWAVAKSNLAIIPPSMAFRVVTGTTGAAAIEWSGLTEWSADELLRTKPTIAAPKTSEAVALLQHFLADGPCLRSDIEQAAAAAAIGWRTVEAAKTTLGIVARQISEKGHRGRGPSFWALPGAEWPPAVPSAVEEAI